MFATWFTYENNLVLFLGLESSYRLRSNFYSLSLILKIKFRIVVNKEHLNFHP